MKKLGCALLLLFFAWLFHDRPPHQLTNLMLMLIFWALMTGSNR